MSLQDSQERVTEGSPTGSVDTKPKKMEKEPVSKVTSGTGKERLKAGASGFAGGRGEVGDGYGPAWEGRVGPWIWEDSRHGALG